MKHYSTKLILHIQLSVLKLQTHLTSVVCLTVLQVLTKLVTIQQLEYLVLVTQFTKVCLQQQLKH